MEKYSRGPTQKYQIIVYAETILWPPNVNKIHKLKFFIKWYITRSVKTP